jgi:hypothetical protein
MPGLQAPHMMFGLAIGLKTSCPLAFERFLHIAIGDERIGPLPT